MINYCHWIDKWSHQKGQFQIWHILTHLTTKIEFSKWKKKKENMLQMVLKDKRHLLAWHGINKNTDAFWEMYTQ